MSESICLIVDGEPAIRTLIRTILAYRKLQSVESENATHAFSVVQKLGGRVDLIVSEINTSSNMDGLDLAHSVRNVFPSIPIILVSGYNHNAAGFDLILKPFSPEALLNAVDRAMSLRPERAFHAAGGHQ